MSLLQIYVIVLIVCCQQHQGAPVSHGRLEYGAYFTRLPTPLNNGHSYMLVQAKVLQMDIAKVSPPGKIAPTIQSSNSLRDSSIVLDEHIAELYDEVVSRHDLLLRMLREIKATAKYRPKRALANFVGSLSKSLFNTATMDDIVMVANQVSSFDEELHREIDLIDDVVDILGRLDRNRLKFLKEYRQNLNTTSTNFGHLDHKLQAFKKAIAGSFRNMSLLSIQTDQNTLSILSGLVEYSNYLRLKQSLNHWINCLSSLMHGTIPASLLSREQADRLITAVNHRLSSKGLDFRSAADASYIYRHAVGRPIYERGAVSVQIALPVSRPNTVFRMYSLETVSIPTLSSLTSGGPATSTRLSGVPDLLGINDQTGDYIEIYRREIAACGNGDALMCEQPFTTYSSNRLTCAVALFKNDVGGIQRLCSFNHYKTPSLARAVSLGNSSYFVISHNSKLTRNCKGSLPSTVHLKSRMSTISVPCNCEMTVDNMSLTSSLHSCKNLSMKFNVGNVVNVPALATFNRLSFESIHLLSDISWNMSALENVSRYSLDSLDTLIDGSRDISRLTNKLHDDIRSEKVRINNSTRSWRYGSFSIGFDVISTACHILTILSFVLVLYQHVRLRQLQAITLALSIRMARAQPNLHDLLRGMTSVETTNSGNEYEITASMIMLASFGLLCAIYAITRVCGMLRRTIRRNRIRNGYIALKFNYGWHSLLIPLKEVPQEPNVIKVSAPDFDFAIVPNGKYFPSILTVQTYGSIEFKHGTVRTWPGTAGNTSTLLINIPLMDRRLMGWIWRKYKLPEITTVLVRGDKISQILTRRDRNGPLLMLAAE